MNIAQISPMADAKLHVQMEDGTSGIFDVTPYLQFPAFKALASESEFSKLTNGGYYIAWACGADLSVDTIVAHWQPLFSSPLGQSA